MEYSGPRTRTSRTPRKTRCGASSKLFLDFATTAACCRVAVHTALNVKRSHRVRGEGRLDPLEAEDLVAPGPSPAEELASAGRREALREIFATLPTDQAAALILHLVLGFTIEETAA